MDEYTYKDLIINPETPGLEGLIGKEVYSDNTPLGCLQRANKSYGVGILREIRKDDYRPFYVEYPNGMMLTFICIIPKKEEPKPKYVPFESKEEFIEAFHYHDNDKYSETDDILLNYGMWLKSMCLGNFYQVTIIKKSGIFTDDNSSIITWEQLLEKYTFLDDSPCGRLVEEKHE